MDILFQTSWTSWEVLGFARAPAMGAGAIGALGSVPGTVCAHPLDVIKIRCLAASVVVDYWRVNMEILRLKAYYFNNEQMASPGSFGVFENSRAESEGQKASKSEGVTEQISSLRGQTF